MKLKISQGFTLLEMLVVIGLIGIILSLAATSYTTAQKKARDSKRKSDLRAIQSSLEQYYSVCGYVYPVVAPGTAVPPIVCANPSTAIMPTIPVDPKKGDSYIMTTSDDSKFTICVPTRAVAPQYLESETRTTAYCLSSQQ